MNLVLGRGTHQTKPFSHSIARRQSTPNARNGCRPSTSEYNTLRIPTDKFDEERLMLASANTRALKTLQHFPAGMYATQSRQSSRATNSRPSSNRLNLFDVADLPASKGQHSNRFHILRSKLPRNMGMSIRLTRQSKNKSQSTYSARLMQYEEELAQNRTTLIEYFTEFGQNSSKLQSSRNRTPQPTSRTIEVTSKRPPLIGSLLRHKLKGHVKKTNDQQEKDKQILRSRVAYFNKFLELI